MELTLFERWFPQRALKRSLARYQVERLKERYFDGGKASPYRPKNPGLGPDTSPQAITLDGSENLRRYARNLDENNGVAISVLDTLVNNIVGTGIPILPAIKNTDGSLNEQANTQVRKILEDWGRRPTADRTTTFRQAQRLLCRSWLRDGEVFLNQLRGNMAGFDHYGAIPYSLEMLESDFVPFSLNESEPRIIAQGVQVDKYYRPLAYYISRRHPGDIWNAGAGIFTSETDFQRVSAENVLHLKFVRRINQVRGQSLLHGAIRGLEDMGDYLQSEQIAARVAAAFTGYIKKSPDVQSPVDPDTGARDLQMAPGMIFDNLQAGEEVGTIDPGRPNPEVNNFVGGMQRRIAAATGTSYSTVSRDYEGSYSSQRQAMVEIKSSYDILRDYFVEMFVRPVYEEVVTMAINTRALSIPRTVQQDTTLEVMFPKSALPWIDPKKEVEADVLRIDNGLAARSQVIAERGSDPAQVAKQREADKMLFEDDEVEANVDTGAGNGQSEDEATATEGDTAAQD